MFKYIFFFYLPTISFISEEEIPKINFSLFRSNSFFFFSLLFRLYFYWIFIKVKIRVFIYILLASYLGTFLRLFIDNNFIISTIGSFFVGFFIFKRLSYSNEQILFSGFLSCFTSFSGFIYFLYKIVDQGDWIKFIIFFNLIIIVNLCSMNFGFWTSKKLLR